MSTRCRLTRLKSTRWSCIPRSRSLVWVGTKEQSQSSPPQPPPLGSRIKSTPPPSTTAASSRKLRKESLSPLDYRGYVHSIQSLALAGHYLKVKYLARDILRDSNTSRNLRIYIQSHIMLAHTNHLINTINASRTPEGNISFGDLLPLSRNEYTPFTHSFYESFPQDDDDLEPVHWRRRLEFLRVAHSVNPNAFPYTCFQDHLNQQIASGCEISMDDLYLAVYSLVTSPQLTHGEIETSRSFASAEEWKKICSTLLAEILKLFQTVSRPFNFAILDNIKTYGLLYSGLKQGTQDYRACVVAPSRDHGINTILSAIQLKRGKDQDKNMKLDMMIDDYIVGLSKKSMKDLIILYRSEINKRSIRQCASLDSRANQLVELSSAYNVPWSVDFVLMILTVTARAQDFKTFFRTWRSLTLSGISPTPKLATIMIGLVVSSRNHKVIEALLLKEIYVNPKGSCIIVSGQSMPLSVDLVEVLNYGLEQVDPSQQGYRKLRRAIQQFYLDPARSQQPPMYSPSDIQNQKWDWGLKFL